MNELEKLKADYLGRLEKSLYALENNFMKRKAHNTSKDDLSGAIYMLHGLAGTGGTFGFPAISETARAAEIFLADAIRPLDQDQHLDEATFAIFIEKSAALARACRAAIDGGLAVQPAPPHTPATPQSQPRTRPALVLMVDDDDSVSGALGAALRAQGFDTDTAHNQHEAMEKIQRQKPDLITLDIGLPGQNGHVILRQLKQSPAYAGIPIIMISGNIQDRHVDGAIAYGAVDYIFKPIDAAHTARKISRILNARGQIILVVDNDPFILKLIQAKFRHTGFEIMTAENGHDALDMIAQKTPNLVMLDMLMPGMDGVAFLRELRQAHDATSLPVIVMSTYDDRETKATALAAGAQEYHVKPFVIEDMIVAAMRLMCT